MHLEMFDDNDLTEWQLNYKQCLNDPRIRRDLVSRAGEHLGFVSISQGNNGIRWIGPVNKERGTIEFLYTNGATAHYCSYYPGIRTTIIFDPSYGRNGGFPLESWMRSAFNRIFPRWRMFENATPLQMWNSDINESDDTWCQTWSLAMLHPYLQDTVLGWAETRNVSLYFRRRHAQEMVAYFANSLTEEAFLEAFAPNIHRARRAWRLHREVLEFGLHNVWWRVYSNEARTPVTPYQVPAAPHRDMSGARQLQF